MAYLDFSSWSLETLPYHRHDPFSVYNIGRSNFISRPKSWNDLIFSEMFIRMWTLLSKYGELYTHSPINGQWENVYVPELNGHCIGSAKHFANKNKRFHYAEGITTQCPFSVHAANVIRNSKYEAFIDYTRPVHRDNREHLRFKAIVFDEDFSDYCYRNQLKNPSDRLPYLRKQGSCCLTYRPLIIGDIEGFRYTDDDAEQSLADIESFFNLHSQFDSVKDNQFHLSKKSLR